MIKKNSINKAFCFRGQRIIGFKSAFLPVLIPILSLILVSSLTSAMKEEDLSTIVKNIRPSIVVVIAYDNESKVLSQGSGFFVSKEGDIVTNRHVIIGASAVEVKTADGSKYTVNKIISEDVIGDLIKMRIATLPAPSRPVIISATLPDVGQKVLVIGSPMGLEQTLSDGVVSSIRQLPSFGNIIQISAPISSGSSGSPVFNLNGEVVGVASYQIASGQNLNFAVPAERLAKLSAGAGKSIADWAKKEETTSSKKDWIIEGWLLIVKDEYEKAISCFELAAKENPANSEPYQLIGDCKSKLGRIEEAKKAYEQAIRINPDDASAYNGLGWLYIGLKRYAEALDAFKQAIRIYPDYDSHHYSLGYTYGELGRYDESIEAYKQAIRLWPRNVDAYKNIAWTYKQLGQNSEAIKAYEQAIQTKPEDADTYEGLADAYANLGRWYDSRDSYIQAIRLKPNSATAHYYLGHAYLILKDRSSALDEYKILKGLDKTLAEKLFNSLYK